MPRIAPTSRFARLNGTFVPLLVALLILLVAAPLVEGWPLLATFLVSFVLVAGVFAVQGSPLVRLGAVAAFVVVLALRWLAHMRGEDHRTLMAVSHLATGMYMLLLGWICVAAVLRREQITRDTVLGAVCGYILIAYVFTFAYAVLEDVRPGSFSNTVVLPGDHGARMGHLTPELLYYSFTTLTTVGYGDIFPVHPLARSLSILEMLAGPLYLAAFVARLVGVMNAGRSGSRDE